MSREIEIDHIGALGDGVAVDGRPTYVPFTLPGETVTAEGDGTHLSLVDVQTASVDRVIPPCPHFGTCGGCQLQHWAAEPYRAWKRDQVVRAFARAGLDVGVEPLIPCPPASRRRATFTARKIDGRTALGFLARGSDRLVAIGPCTILRPVLEAALPHFADVAATILRGNEDVSVSVLEADNGVAVSLGCEQVPSADMVTALVNVAAKAGFVQVALNGDVIFERTEPVVSFADATVTPPPGGFLQAVAAAETGMAALVSDHLAKSKHVADLFAGSGTFAARLASQSRVHAVESQTEALAALAKARLPDGARPLTTEARDLYDAPLHVDELARFDGLCLDPPRAGAEAQVAQIAGSSIAKIAYVSCDAVSLARDLVVFVKSGYRVERVVPFDQFLHTPHVEIVALLSKPKPKAKRSIFR